jgi:metal-sulfur cluster biosynthetic enzyme
MAKAKKGKTSKIKSKAGKGKTGKVGRGVKAKATKASVKANAAGKLTKEGVLAVLKNVIDPEIGLNIVDLGFIYGVDISGNDVRVRMTLTNPGCPMHSMFTHEVVGALETAFDDVRVSVELVFDPPWTPERMTKDARKKLGIK